MLQLLNTNRQTHMNEAEPLYFTKFREHIDHKFSKIDEKFEGIDKRFEGLDKKFEAIDKRFEGLDKKFETYIPQYFKDFQVHIDKKFNAMDTKIESEVNGLAVMIKDNFVTKDEFEDGLNEIRDTMATKEDIKDMATKNDIRIVIEHIGSYEIRAKNIEDILLKDHKPRIIDLEKEVFA